MKANELRIGNYIQKNGEVSVLASINCDDTIRVFNDDKSDTWGCFALRIFEPIKLNKEWALKLGFTQCENEYWYEKGILSTNLNGTINIQGRKYSDVVINTNIDNVHQLQNLYFALTGEELCEE